MRFILHGLSIPFSITHRMLMLFCAFLFVPFLSAQICVDSVYQLQEFELLDKCSPLSEHAAFSVGTQLLQADSAAISRSSSSSLSEYLVKNTPIYIKESGNGMLSTVSLRGTASSHTAVNWNGININPLTMGQVDFSQLPMFFFDEVMVHPGGESALYGSGAIGGSILLGSSRLYKKTLSTELQQSMGSYGSSFSGLKFKVGGKSWQSRTAVMYNRSDNNFKINVPSFSGNDVQEQRNAAYYSYGIQQDLNFKLTAKSELQLNAWHSFYFRSIQPSFQNNLDSASYESLSNTETRVLATYTYSGKWKTENRFGSIYNYQENLGDVIAFQNLIFSSDWMRAWRKVSLKAGVNYQYILPEVYAYSFGVEESRFDVYAMTKYRLLKFMDMGLNLRQGMVTGIAVPFTPSFGLSVLPLRKLHHTLLLRTNIARSFKVPTLNDRYWGGLDNRYLQAEDGRNFELGMNYDYLNKRYRFKTNATAYYNLVKNWILWMPRGDIWKPQNVDLVLANGLEIKMTHEYSWLRHTLFLVTNYNYTLTTVKEGFNDMTPFLGRQMPLLPKHTASALVQYGYKQFSAQVNSNYVGERATSNIYDVMDAYLLFDVSSAYKFKFKHSALTLRAAVNNLFNVDYQSMPYKAMPWRNYQLTLNYFIQ